jgi:PhnB protein
MDMGAFIHFDGQCREAVAFYADIFDAKKAELTLYGELPEHREQPLTEKDRERVAFACLKIKGGTNTIMLFADYPPGKKASKGGNAELAVIVDSGKKVDKLCAKLAEGGKTEIEPNKTFWSKRYAVVTDRFGVRWHIARKS